ncbi:hypothetical protein [Evansella cellulosilytica]|uniref:Uncharacterized protein n=1 Tax=Evansella cellulosilytica (strain ATCC 21833 / DSM 2522 / FERM P-1141 / JCM 9156 / N-4) TaxID=649639 RepID=E6TVF1_EVAC2|nr:hypothetical protein [Evansella cellulosilytica]ADU30968.1 hypothetical protein Bcell_2713 [Evansella cellulosilytica DSM 2522]
MNNYSFSEISKVVQYLHGYNENQLADHITELKIRIDTIERTNRLVKTDPNTTTRFGRAKTQVETLEVKYNELGNTIGNSETANLMTTLYSVDKILNTIEDSTKTGDQV